MTREELDRPYIERDKASDAYACSPQFADDREEVKELIGKLAADPARFGTILMRKYGIFIAF